MRIMKVSWKEYKSNEEVLSMKNSKRMLVEMIKRRKLAYFGHLVKRDDIQRLLPDGKIYGKRSRGKQQLTWADKHHRMDRNDVQRIYEGGTRPREMEIHDSRHAGSRWHQMMMIPLSIHIDSY